jgi:HipA-like protein
MNIIKKIKLFWHDSDETNLQAVKGSKGRFDLLLGNMPVGILSYEDGIWSFVYTDEYKQQNHYEPLVNFPNLNQEYKSEQLWPFFASRLPGVSELKGEGTSSSDVLSLLRKYGQHVITNPYKLVAL